MDQVLQRGNMINNIEDAYSEAVSVEYHFPGFDPKYEGMDWESLKLVLSKAVIIGISWGLSMRPGQFKKRYAQSGLNRDRDR
jgi:hypothetical protein